jgi:hypothetical protein
MAKTKLEPLNTKQVRRILIYIKPAIIAYPCFDLFEWTFLHQLVHVHWRVDIWPINSKIHHCIELGVKFNSYTICYCCCFWPNWEITKPATSLVPAPPWVQTQQSQTTYLQSTTRWRPVNVSNVSERWSARDHCSIKGQIRLPHLRQRFLCFSWVIVLPD